MKTTVVNILLEDMDEYIGRGKFGNGLLDTEIGERGWLGNPFVISGNMSRARAIELYRIAFYQRIESDPEFAKAVLALKGKRLGCFCKPLECHGDLIVEFLESIKQEEE